MVAAPVHTAGATPVEVPAVHTAGEAGEVHASPVTVLTPATGVEAEEAPQPVTVDLEPVTVDLDPV